MIDFALPEDVARLDAEARRVATEVLRPRMRDAERAGAWDADAARVVAGFELAALDLPADRGGAGAGLLTKVVVLEALASGDAAGLPAADPLGPAAGAAPLARTEWPRAPLAMAGMPRLEWIPSAPRHVWLTSGDRLLFLDASRCAATPAAGAAFHASGGVSVALDGGVVDDELRLTPEQAVAVRGHGRLWYAAVALGVGAAALDHATAYARERVVMGKPVAHHQGNAFAIAEATAELEAARLAVRAAAVRLDGGEPWAGLWATLGWLDAMDAAARATDLGVQLLGGHGYVEDHPVEKWFREARMLALLFGGRDAALDDAAACVLDAPDPVMP